MTRQQVNLYNPALRQPRERVSAANLAIAAGACLLLVLVAGTVARQMLASAKAESAVAAQSLKTVQEQFAATSARLAEQKPDPALQREVDAAQAVLKSREEVLAALANVSIEPGGAGFAAYLRGLARQTVQGVWLTGISIGPGSELSLTGRTINQSLVAQYVKRLGAEPVFSGRSFSQLSMAEVPGKNEKEAKPAASERPLEFHLTTSPAAGASGPAPSGAAGAPFNVASLAGAQR